MRTFKSWPAILGAALLGVVAACGVSQSDVLTRAKEFSKSKEAAGATVSLESVFLGQPPLKGTYRSDGAQKIEYILSNSGGRIELRQAGKEAWLVISDAAAVHLTPEDLTEEEYALLRNAFGPFGVPLLSMPDLLNMIETRCKFTMLADSSKSGDDRIFASPNARFRAALASWVALQSAADMRLVGLLIPDTIVLRISKKDGRILELQELNSLGHSLAKMTFDFSAPPSSPSAPFKPPAGQNVIGTRELMLALGADANWLKGKALPAGTIQSLDGRSMQISDFAGKPMLINFWATWCGPCRIEWPVIQELFSKHGKNVSFVLLTDEPAPTVRNYLKANGYSAPVYLMRDEVLSRRFGVNGIPATFFVDSSGVIRNGFVGFPRGPSIEASRAEIRERYESILADLLNSPAAEAPSQPNGM